MVADMLDHDQRIFPMMQNSDLCAVQFCAHDMTLQEYMSLYGGSHPDNFRVFFGCTRESHKLSALVTAVETCFQLVRVSAMSGQMFVTLLQMFTRRVSLISVAPNGKFSSDVKITCVQ